MKDKVGRRVTVMLLLAFVPFGQFSLATTASCAEARAESSKSPKVSTWFQKYDEIRHTAQMSDDERDRSKKLMAQGLTSSIFGSANAAQDKAASCALLKKMIDRYRQASASMNSLQQCPETRKLHKGYQQYFNTAGGIFSDYLKVQTNLTATDNKGNPILGQLPQRKADLETLDKANKDLDSQLRDKYNIAPYAY